MLQLLSIERQEEELDDLVTLASTTSSSNCNLEFFIPISISRVDCEGSMYSVNIRMLNSTDLICQHVNCLNGYNFQNLTFLNESFDSLQILPSTSSLCDVVTSNPSGRSDSNSITDFLTNMIIVAASSGGGGALCIITCVLIILCVKYGRQTYKKKRTW